MSDAGKIALGFLVAPLLAVGVIVMFPIVALGSCLHALGDDILSRRRK